MKTIWILMIVLLLACSTVMEEPQIKYPQRNVIPVEIGIDLVDYGYSYLGHFVTDVGGIAIFAEKDGECQCLIFIPYAANVMSATCDECLEAYNTLCVIENKCNIDPFRGDMEVQDNEI